MRHGNSKLVRDAAGAPFELYNIKKDPYEKVHLAQQEPERQTEAILANVRRLLRAPF